jgi:hypothetical protein
MAEIVVTIAKERDRLGLRCLLVAILSTIDLNEQTRYSTIYEFVRGARPYVDTILFLYNDEPLTFSLSVPDDADIEMLRTAFAYNLMQLQRWLTQIEQG